MEYPSGESPPVERTDEEPTPGQEKPSKKTSLSETVKRKGKEITVVVGAVAAFSGALGEAKGSPHEARPEDAASAVDRMEMGNTVENTTEHQELNRRLIGLRDRLRGFGINVQKLTLREARAERRVDLHVDQIIMQNPDRAAITDADIKPPPAVELLYEDSRERESYLSSHDTSVPYTTTSEFPEIYADARVEIVIDTIQPGGGSGRVVGTGEARVPPGRRRSGNDWPAAKRDALAQAVDRAEASIIRTTLQAQSDR